MSNKIDILTLILLFLGLPSFSHGWGVDGHLITCQIAQNLLTESAANAVKQLLPTFADDDLSSLCSWADKVKFKYPWSSPLHYIDTPDHLCNYNYDRDCKNENGDKGMCVSGAINNYTNQLLAYGSSFSSAYNLTESLLFLSHFIGDIHQPLHVGFTSDKGGNAIDVHWYTKKEVLHHVWDDDIIETAEERFYNSDVEQFVNAIRQNISGSWSDQVEKWQKCSYNKTSCPDVYATESITAACQWAYRNATEGSVLDDDYFLSRLPVVNLRLAEGGVRLAATLNRIFRQ
ncbi:endonuclease 2 [Dioscorea cayenensis subsp. rotundata]|uniref:Aspergillus nuclease S1 n=1 Tax=Dioscorea cayennensis subsp. rotundata TaxID=55577 RepID=A0AB40CUP9_DIOCR|nr:endonuclease 2 [Dioscorea cayenensis subsp. rotundata]